MANGVVVKLTFPEGIAVTAMDGRCSGQGTVACTLGNLPVYEQADASDSQQVLGFTLSIDPAWSFMRLTPLLDVPPTTIMKR